MHGRSHSHERTDTRTHAHTHTRCVSVRNICMYPTIKNKTWKKNHICTYPTIYARPETSTKGSRIAQKQKYAICISLPRTSFPPLNAHNDSFPHDAIILKRDVSAYIYI